MIFQITLREANQNFSHFIKEVEGGDEIIITRHGKAVARIIPVSEKISKTFTESQLKAKARVLARMAKGLNLGLGGKPFDRESLYER